MSATREKKKEQHHNRGHWIALTLEITIVLVCFYFFVVALDFLNIGLKLIVGRALSRIYKLGSYLDYKIPALVVGILMSVFVQSTVWASIVVGSMVASESLSVRAAIPIVMGTNVGSTITSTIVAFSHFRNNYKFKKALSDAVLHDIFNLLSALILLPVESITGFLEVTSDLLVKPLIKLGHKGMKIDILFALTKPFTELIVKFDDKVLEAIARGNLSNYSMMVTAQKPLLKTECGVKYAEKECLYLLRLIDDWPEKLVGFILIVASILLVAICLLGLKRSLNLIFTEQKAAKVRQFIDKDLPGRFKYFTGVLLIFIGIVLTIIIQSSSVFASMLTLLVAVGLISIERVFLLILGANIGITFTGVLVALGGSRKTLVHSLQIHLSHLIFNITGSIIWYTIGIFYNLPIKMACRVGATSAKYRWFSVIYVLLFFIIIPLFLFGLAFAHRAVFVCTISIIIAVILLIIALNIFQQKCPACLPERLQTWDFMPRAFRSLEPYDRFFRTLDEISWCALDDGIQFVRVDDDESKSALLLDQSKLYDLNKLSLKRDDNSSKSSSSN